MAVIQTKGSGPFGGFGGFATALGMMTGQPWLGAVGMGMNAVDGMYTGGGGGSGGGMGNIDQMLDYMKQAGWINPASGNIAKKNTGFNGDSTDVLQYFRGLMS